jgi:hypothetical protein
MSLCIFVDVCDMPVKCIPQLLLIIRSLGTMPSRGSAKYFVGAQRTASFHGNIRKPFGDPDSRFLRW